MSKTIIRFRKKNAGFRGGLWLIPVLVIGLCGYIVAGGDVSGPARWLNRVTSEPEPEIRRTLRGYAHVRDGDTIVIGGESIRLEGIDAFELSQTCGQMACGLQAKQTLQRLLLDGPVVCDDVGRDTYDRVLGLCRNAHGTDINEAMVRSGYAIAYLYYTDRYEEAHKQAQASRRGAWAQGFVEPYEYRQNSR